MITCNSSGNILYRKYGFDPISVAVLHGGPAGWGEMAPVATKIATYIGVVEPFQRSPSIDGELCDMKSIFEKEVSGPLVVVGYSYGAWVACLFAAQFPQLVRKLILIGCPPFEEKDAEVIMKTRLKRMNEKEQEELHSLRQQLQEEGIDKNAVFANLASLFRKVDSYDPSSETDELVCDYSLHAKIWEEAATLRHSGKLLNSLSGILCPVCALHGESDPHPAQAAFSILSQRVHSFRGIILQECGHTPWIEKKAYDRFFSLLKEEILSGL
jgi:pimeloyl-ACP methyl ester carboxylesterase